MSSSTVNSAGGADYTTIIAAITAADAAPTANRVRVVGGGPYTEALNVAAVYGKIIELVNETGVIIGCATTANCNWGQGSWIHGTVGAGGPVGPGFAFTGNYVHGYFNHAIVGAGTTKIEDCTFTTTNNAVVLEGITQTAVVSRCSHVGSSINIAYNVTGGTIANTVNFTLEDCTSAGTYAGFVDNSAALGTRIVRNCTLVGVTASGIAVSAANGTWWIYGNKSTSVTADFSWNGTGTPTIWCVHNTLMGTALSVRTSLGTVNPNLHIIDCCGTNWNTTNACDEHHNSYVSFAAGTPGANDVQVTSAAAWLLGADDTPAFSEQQPLDRTRSSPLVGAGIAVAGVPSDCRGNPFPSDCPTIGRAQPRLTQIRDARGNRSVGRGNFRQLRTA